MHEGIDPVRIDTEIAGLHEKARRASRVLDAAWSVIHRLAGDRQEHRPHIGYIWLMSHEDALDAVKAKAEEHPRDEADKLLIALSEEHFRNQLKDLQLAIRNHRYLLNEISRLDAIWLQHRWSRYYPCLNADGHIHSSERGCSTVRPDTLMGWYPDMSGKTFAEAVASKGPTLCSACFPDAPVEWRQKRSDIEREARATAKAARQTVLASKNLARNDSLAAIVITAGRGEQFRDTWGWVTTVAGCKKVLRDEVEYRDYSGGGRHPDHATTAEAAEHAKRVLLAREAARPGSGATQAEIDKIIENAVKKNRREGARI